MLLNVNDTRDNKNNGISNSNDNSEILHIIGDITRKIDHIIDTTVNEASELSKTAKMILMSLDKKEGQTQLDIANNIFMKAPTVSLTAQKLETKGYIERRIDNYDLRAIRVYLTDKGKEFCRKVNETIESHNINMFEPLSELEKKQLLRVLNVVKNNLG